MLADEWWNTLSFLMLINARNEVRGKELLPPMTKAGRVEIEPPTHCASMTSI